MPTGSPLSRVHAAHRTWNGFVLASLSTRQLCQGRHALGGLPIPEPGKGDPRKDQRRRSATTQVRFRCSLAVVVENWDRSTRRPLPFRRLMPHQTRPFCCLISGARNVERTQPGGICNYNNTKHTNKSGSEGRSGKVRIARVFVLISCLRCCQLNWGVTGRRGATQQKTGGFYIGHCVL